MKKVIVTSLLVIASVVSLYTLPHMLKSRDLDPDLLAGMTDGLIERVIPVHIPEAANAYNPGFIRFKDHYLLAFRYDYPPKISLERLQKETTPYLGIVELDVNFKPIRKFQLLNTRPDNPHVPQQAEDPRLVRVADKIYLFFNDNQKGTRYGERQIYFAEVFQDDTRFFLGPIRKVDPPHRKASYEKNWMPFAYRGDLYVVYMVDPHTIFKINPNNGEVEEFYNTTYGYQWDYGPLRGGTQAVELPEEGEYIAFTHSSLSARPTWLKRRIGMVYFMGAYTFENQPPFHVKRLSPAPITDKSFYVSKNRRKVIFPSGVVHNGNKLYVAFGQNDSYMNIAVIDKKKLLQTLKPVEAKESE